MLLYFIAAQVAAWFSPKAKDWVMGRRNTRQLLNSFILTSGKTCVWFHCSSLGEFEQARPLIEQVKRNYANSFVLLTFFSPSGYNIRKNFPLADVVCYLPHDSKSNAQKLIRVFQPKLVFWTKYDFYFHFLNELQRAQIPTVLFAARFLPHQIFFKQHGLLFRYMLQCFTKIFVQDAQSLALLASINIKSEQANDTRFDRVLVIAAERKHFDAVEKFIGGKQAMVCGSTWLQDEQLLAHLINSNILKDTVWIIAPHNPSPANIEAIQKLLSTKALLYSDLYSNTTTTASNTLIINNIGILSSLYAYASIAYIGGGFGVSVHNVLEAAVYGVPVLFGPNHKKSLECVDLIHQGAAFAVSNHQELESHLLQLQQNKQAVKSGETARNYVQSHAGGTDKIFTFAQHYLA